MEILSRSSETFAVYNNDGLILDFENLEFGKNTSRNDRFTGEQLFYLRKAIRQGGLNLEPTKVLTFHSVYNMPIPSFRKKDFEEVVPYYLPPKPTKGFVVVSEDGATMTGDKFSFNNISDFREDLQGAYVFSPDTLLIILNPAITWVAHHPKHVIAASYDPESGVQRNSTNLEDTLLLWQELIVERQKT